MGSSPKQPAPPDYSALAAQDAFQQQQMLQMQTTQNRPTQTNAQGSLNWSQDPTTGAWTQSENLSPQMQALWNQAYQGQQATQNLYGWQQQDVASLMNRPDSFQGQTYENQGINSGTYQGQDLGMGQFNPQTGTIGNFKPQTGAIGDYQQQQLGVGGYNQQQLGVGGYQGQGAQGISQYPGQGQGANAVSQYQGPMSINQPDFKQSIGQMGNYNSQYDPNSDKFADTFTKAALARVTPQQEVDKKSMETQLRLQGLQPGSEAYNRAYQNLLTSQGDVRAQATLQGMLAGGQEGRARSEEARNIYGTQLQSNLQRQQMNQSNYQTALQSALQKGQYAQGAYQTQLQGQMARGGERRAEYAQQLQGQQARGGEGRADYQQQLQSALARGEFGRGEYQTQLQSALQRGEFGRGEYAQQLQTQLSRGEAGRADYAQQLQGQLARGEAGRADYNTMLQSALERGQFNREDYQTQFDAEKTRAEQDRIGNAQQWQQMMQQYMMPYEIADRQSQMIAGAQGPGVNEIRPSFQNYTAAGQGTAANMMDAAQQSYAAQVQRANDAAAARQARNSTYGAVAGGIIGAFTPVGPAGGAAIGGAVGSAFSDADLKDEIEVISDEDAYNAMQRIFPHSFVWPSGKRAAGLVAQEVEKEFPHLVSRAEQGYLMVDYEAFTALLLGAFRHLARRNENAHL